MIGKGRSAVITTGTGSGKTDSFLFPILNELLSEVESGNKEVGIRRWNMGLGIIIIGIGIIVCGGSLLGTKK